MGWISTTKLGGGSSSFESKAAPEDVGNLAYIIYYGLGASLLLPWNSYITAVDYFDYLYPQTHIDRVFSVAYTFPCLFCLVVLLFYGQKFSSWVRINTGLGLFLVCIVLMPLMDAIFIDVDKGGSRGTLYITVSTLVVSGIADAIVQGSLYGSAGELPERYMQAAMAGSGGSGVLVSCLRIATKAALPQTPRGLRQSGNVYFGVSAAFLALCLVSFNLMHKLPVLDYYQRQKIQRLKLVSTAAGSEALIGEEDSESELDPSKLPSSAIKMSPGRDTLGTAGYKRVLGQVKWLALSVTLIYIVTLSIFPGFLAEDVHSAALADWYPVLLMTAYNVFDLVGKQMTAVYILDSKPAMIGGSVARLVFYPLYFTCLRGPRLLRTEVPVFFLTSLLGATNGFLTSCLFVVTPKTVPLADAETTGVVMVIALVLGLACGSVVSWFWVI